MRLLHLDESGRPILTDFSRKTIPRYAILSHRWGGDEVSYDDIVNDSYERKAGYDKFVFCGKQAAQDEIQYFWIDTCCINKWNRREREKAVNSMFDWYHNAAKCYVFLSDVSAATPEDAHQRNSWETSFRASQWFTRGWTLQELLAPASIQFFSVEGQLLGDKGSLEQLIHEITRIPIEALQSRPLEDFSVSDRIEWARTRKTTEPEDGAYCLLGILNMEMPLTYGEGKEKAFSRLQEELEATRVSSIIPYSRNDRFVGRQSQLAELEAKLFSSKQTTRIAIVGEGGTGKSQLALELAHRTRQSEKKCSVFWIDASNLDSLYQGHAHVARKLGILDSNKDEADSQKLVQAHLSERETGRWLLIYDNLDDMNLESTNLFTPSTDNLIKYLPQSELGSVIFTTTNSNVVERLALENIIELREMTPDAAQMMFEKYFGNPIASSEQRQASLLLKELLYLPLAIVQAAAYINSTGKAIADYRLLLEKKKVTALANKKSDQNLQEFDTSDLIATTWLISFEQIRDADPIAADMLCFMACICQKDISLELLETVSSYRTEDAVHTLDAYALITRRPAELALDIHRLVHDAMREWLKKHDLLAHWIGVTTRRLLQVFPDDDHRNRHKWRRLLPHAQSALSQGFYEVDRDSSDAITKNDNETRTDLASKCAIALNSDGRYRDAEQLVRLVVESRTRLLGEEHPSTLVGLSNLALTFWSQGRWKEAEKLEVRLVETKKRVLGEEHPSTLLSMGNLASTFWNQGRWKEAEKLDMQVMEMKKRVLGEEHPDTLISMANLASTYGDQGRWKEAEELEIRVVETKKRVLGEEHPSTLLSMCNLTLTYSDQGRWKEAEELGMQVIESRKRVLGEEHPSTLLSMGNLATTFWKQGRWKDAEELQTQVMETRKRVLGEEHPETLFSMNNLALVYGSQSGWKAAEELHMQVLEIKKRVLGEEHHSTLLSTGNLALVLWNQGQWKEAEVLEMQLMETRTRLLGEEHPDTLLSMHNLAYRWEKQGRDEEAIKLMSKCVQLRTQNQGADHPSTLSSVELLDDWKLAKLDIHSTK